jgi:hypothetical protein
MAMADGVPCRTTTETSMSKHQEKLERKSPAKPEIGKGRGALEENDLEQVTGGQISIPFKQIEIEYKEQDSKGQNP